MKKNNFRILIGTSLALSFSITDANANGMLQAPLLHDSWSGAYFGAYFGAGDGDVDHSNSQVTLFRESNSGPLSSIVTTQNFIESGKAHGNISGSMADLFIGYNYRHPCYDQFLVGAQLEGTFFSNIALQSTGTLNGTATSITEVRTATTTQISTTHGTVSDAFDHAEDLSSMFSLVARAGYLLMPCLLIYGLAGATEGNFVLPCGNENNFGTRRNQWNLGYTVGLGLEYRFNDNWSVLAEYRFLHFDYNRHQSFSNASTMSTTTFQSSEGNFSATLHNHFNFNLGKLGIVYRFC